MKHSEKITPVAAAISALSTMACCLPSGIAAAAGAAGLGAVVEPLRPWLIGLSIGLLILGFVQLYRSNRSCRRRSPLSIAVFSISAVVVAAILLFPQISAGLLANVRVRQFWDKEHAVAKAMAESRVGQPQQDCCERNGTLWDLLAVYPAGAEWGETLPRATVFNGPVVRAVAATKIF